MYDKGAAVLHMLRYVVGDDDFFRILKEYYQEYKFELVTTDDFMNICERVYGKDLECTPMIGQVGLGESGGVLHYSAE